jgi:dethiobiotin synthetase
VTVRIVSGTGTDVGKTVATAALAACAPGSVAVVTPAQTGVAPDDPGDLAEVARLAGVSERHEYARYPHPLSPHHAAAVSGRAPLVLDDVAERIADLAARFDLVLVEGAGGLLVPFDRPGGWTVLELGRQLDAEFVVVVAAGLGTLNHTALTLRAFAGGPAPHLVIGSWPEQPDLAMRCNVADLDEMAGARGLAGALPAGMSRVQDFASAARAALAAQLGGSFDAAAFRAAHQP